MLDPMYLGKSGGDLTQRGERLALAILERMEAYSSGNVMDFMGYATLLWALPSPHQILACGPYCKFAHLVSDI